MQRLLEYAAHHRGLTVLALGAVLAVLVYEFRERARAVGAVSPQDAVRLMNMGATLLDLRSAEAYTAGHIRGARHLPPERLADGLEALKRLRDRKVIVYCERGASAAGAMRALQQQGFSQVVTLRGGLSAWRAEHLPVARD
ncbi:MAG TPA: rhodanese-like domain-containing protein [Steroidobacteraceae bacterium]